MKSFWKCHYCFCFSFLMLFFASHVNAEEGTEETETEEAAEETVTEETAGKDADETVTEETAEKDADETEPEEAADDAEKIDAAPKPVATETTLGQMGIGFAVSGSMHAAEMLSTHYKVGVSKNDDGIETGGLGPTIGHQNRALTPGMAAGLSVLYGNSAEEREVSYTKPLLWTYGGELLLCTTDCLLTFLALGNICFVALSAEPGTTTASEEAKKWMPAFYGIRAARVLNSTLTPALVYRAEANATQDSVAENPTPKGGSAKQALKLAQQMTY